MSDYWRGRIMFGRFYLALGIDWTSCAGGARIFMCDENELDEIESGITVMVGPFDFEAGFVRAA